MDNKTKIGVLEALVDTAKQWTTLENVYNDGDGRNESFSWDEVDQAVGEIIEDLTDEL